MVTSTYIKSTESTSHIKGGCLLWKKKNYFVKEGQNAIKEMPGQIWRWKAALSGVMKQARYNAFLLKGSSEHK